MAEMRYTPEEEIANSFTHGLGLVASIVGVVVLIFLAAVRGDEWQIVGSCMYGASLVALYTASTLYHVSRHAETKRLLRTLDHCAIYLLIAGTYTPFVLVGLRGGWGWTLFGVVWRLCVAGIAFKLFFTGRFNALSTTVYVMMGWLCVVAVKPMVEILSGSVLAWLLAGGILCTAGTAFYHNRRLPYSHATWHVFVIAGTACHYLAVFQHVLDPGV